MPMRLGNGSGAVVQAIKELQETVCDRLDRMDGRLKEIEGQLGTINTRVRDMDKKLAVIEYEATSLAKERQSVRTALNEAQEQLAPRGR